jgi:chaperonin GroEL
LVDKKITDASEIIRILDTAVKEDYPLLIVAEDVEEKAMADLIKNKLKGTIKVAAVKAFSFGEQKTQCLDDIAVMTGGTTVNHQPKVPNQYNPSHQHILFGFQVQ